SGGEASPGGGGRRGARAHARRLHCGDPPAPGAPRAWSPARGAARGRGTRRRTGRRGGPAPTARVPDGETPHVRSMTVRTTATQDVLAHESLRLPVDAT